MLSCIAMCQIMRMSVAISFVEGETIYEPSVVDKDRGLNSKLTYSIVQVTTAGRKTNPFSIDRNNGKVTLIGKNPLNFETADTYVIIIKVEDSGSPRKYGKSRFTSYLIILSTVMFFYVSFSLFSFYELKF